MKNGWIRVILKVLSTGKGTINMIYKMEYLDADRNILMAEHVNSDDDTDRVLRHSCEKAVKRYEQLKQRLSEKIKDVSPRKFFYKVNGHEGAVYSMHGNERIVADIQVCTPVMTSMK